MNNKVTQSEMNELPSRLSARVNALVDNTNKLNDSIMKALDMTASGINSILSKAVSVSEGIADMSIVSGLSSKSKGVSDLKVLSSYGCKIVNNSIKMSTSEKVRFPIKETSFIMNGASFGNSFDSGYVVNSSKENILSTSEFLEIESINSSASVSLVLDLGSENLVNFLSLGMHPLSSGKGKILSMSVSRDGKVFHPQEFVEEVGSNIHTLSIKKNSIRFLKLDIVQDTPYTNSNTSSMRYAVKINSLSVGFESADKDSEIIFGPISSKDEILKVSIDTNSDIPDGASIDYQVSSNSIDWIDISSREIFQNKTSSIVSFNTNSNNSISTTLPVTSFYLKIKMSASKVDGDVKVSEIVDRSRQVVSSVNRAIQVPQGSEYEVYLNNSVKYGARVTSSGSITDFNPRCINITRAGKHIIKSVGVQQENTFDLLDKYYEYAPLTMHYSLDLGELTSGDISSVKFSDDFDDSNISIMSYSKPSYVETNIETKGLVFAPSKYDVVLEFNNPAGLYYVRVGTHNVELDLSDGFIRSGHQLIFIVPNEYEDFELYNEIGSRIGKFPTTMVGEVNTVNLYDPLSVVVPDLHNKTYNKNYPLQELASDEFSVEDSGLVFGQYTKMKASLNISRLLGSKVRQIKASYSLDDYDLKNTCKLNHTSITRGTIRFDLSNSSVNAFVKEVPFQDGNSEFIIPSKRSQLNNRGLGEIRIDSNFIDDDGLRFSGPSSDLFINRVYSEEELIDLGDWMIRYSDGHIDIVLPDGVMTSDVVDTEIIYNVNSDKTTSSGLYSVDYSRGIIHTSSPIDGRTKVNYQYLSTYGKYESLTKISPERYEERSGQIEILDAEAGEREYLVVSKKSSSDSREYYSGPKILDLDISYMTDEDFI